MAELIAEVHRRIERGATDAAEVAGLDVSLLSQFGVDMAYSSAARSAKRALFATIGELLPEENRTAAPLPAEFVVARIRPMIVGLLPPAWRQAALREIAARLFILNYAGAKAALDTEFYYELTPPEIEIDCEGGASDHAHVRWPSALHPPIHFTTS